MMKHAWHLNSGRMPTVTNQRFTMKIGRNDPCPSGTGKKFKKCLAAHSGLHAQSSVGEIWWVCGRWQAQTPALHELHTAMTTMHEVDPSKFDAFLDMVFTAPPSQIDFWRNLIMDCGMKRYPDVPGLFRRMSAHLSAAENSELPCIYSSSAAYLWEAHSESFPDVLAATLALDPATTPMESLEMIVEWADTLGLTDDCDRLRQHFPAFPEFMLEEPEEEDEEKATAPDIDDHREESESKFPPEVSAALGKAWEDFEALDSPTHQQAEAFIEELLAQPHEATAWDEVFTAARKSVHADTFKIFHRLAAALSPSRNNVFAYVCWGAVEEVRRLKTPERLPEIARTLLDFNPLVCDPDALSHIADALLAHGFVNELIALMTGFLPNLRENSDVMSWVVPQVSADIFLLRLGSLISSGDYSSRPIEPIIADLRAGLEDDICEESASVPLRYLTQDREQFSREHFMLPRSTKNSDKQQLLWNKHQQAFVDIARDEWHTENRNPSKTLIGLHMILRSVECRLNSPHEKGQKYPLNLLDYLNSAAIDRLIPIECRELLGINYERASVMCDAFLSLIRWTGRQALLTQAESAKAESQLATLAKHIKI